MGVYQSLIFSCRPLRFSQAISLWNSSNGIPTGTSRSGCWRKWRQFWAVCDKLCVVHVCESSREVFSNPLSLKLWIMVSPMGWAKEQKWPQRKMRLISFERFILIKPQEKVFQIIFSFKLWIMAWPQLQGQVKAQTEVAADKKCSGQCSTNSKRFMFVKLLEEDGIKLQIKVKRSQGNKKDNV